MADIKYKKKWNYLNFIIPLLVFFIWYYITKYSNVPDYWLPSPYNILLIATDFLFGNLKLTFYSGTLIMHLIATTQRVLMGFSIACIFGIILGFLSGRIKFIYDLIDPSVHLIRIIPGIGWLPLAMIWFGIGQKTTLFLIGLAAFFPIYVNTAQGSASVSPLYIKAAKMLGDTNLDLFINIIFPASFPHILSGLRLGLGISWAYVVLGELTGVSQGLGAVMMDARMLGYVDMVIVCMVCIGLMGRFTDYLMVFLLKKFLFSYTSDNNA